MPNAFSISYAQRPDTYFPLQKRPTPHGRLHFCSKGFYVSEPAKHNSVIY